MNRLSPRSLRNAYSREKLTGSLILAGGIDILIGGFADHSTLIAFGMLIVLGSISWRWLQIQPARLTDNNAASSSSSSFSRKPIRYLPAASSPLPDLTKQKSKEH